MRLNGIFKNDMVFQRDAEIRIFGETSIDSDAHIRASFIDEAGNIVRTGETHELYEDGFFVLTLEALPVGGPYTLKVEALNEVCYAEDEFYGRYPSVQEFTGVYFGEVWLAGGQSNMVYPLIRTRLARRDVNECPRTNIHFYNVPEHGVYDDLQRKDEDESKWNIIDSTTCGKMSGVAFYFARIIETYLQSVVDGCEELHIGIIGCYSGGSSVSCWQSIETLEKTPQGQKYIDAFADALTKVSPAILDLTARQYKDAWLGYTRKCHEVLKQNPYTTYADMERLVGPSPWPPPDSETSIRRPGALFDTMLLRIVPFSIKGVIFYQGEEDTEEHYDDYAAVFTTMINEWRETFWNEDLPFVFCQLPMFITRDKKYMGYDDLKWPKLREQQEKVSRTVPNTYMAVLSDCGEFDNLHPSDKKTPGERLAQLALRFVYGCEEVPAVAPYVADIRRGEGVEVTFEGDFNMLSMPTAVSADESGFEIADDSGIFYPAHAVVDFDGKTVILTNSKIKNPLRVRYAYFSYGVANLVSDTGLAPAPFQVAIDRSIGEFY